MIDKKQTAPKAEEVIKSKLSINKPRLTTQKLIKSIPIPSLINNLMGKMYY